MRNISWGFSFAIRNWLSRGGRDLSRERVDLRKFTKWAVGHARNGSFLVFPRTRSAVLKAKMHYSWGACARFSFIGNQEKTRRVPNMSVTLLLNCYQSKSPEIERTEIQLKVRAAAVSKAHESKNVRPPTGCTNLNQA